MSNEDLVREIQSGNDVEEHMLQLYDQTKGFIVKIAKQYIGHVELEDLLQEAFIGTVRAAEQYDPGRSESFLHVLAYCLRYVFRTAVYSAQSVHIAYGMQEQVRQYKSMITQHEQLTGQNMSDRDAAAGLNVSLGQLERIKAAAVPVLSMNKPLPDGEFGEMIQDPMDPVEQIEDDLYHEQLKEDLWSEVDKLPPLQSDVIRKHYGSGLTDKQISENDNRPYHIVSGARVRALKALRRSRKIQKYQDIYSDAIRGTGVQSFRRTWTSSTERVALQNIEGMNKL